MDKVTLIEAARLVDLHPNTVRNWRKAGKLKTAEKVLDNNVETWVVDPQEVNQLADHNRSTNGVNNRSYIVNPPDGQPIGEAVAQASTSPGAAISPVQEQTIAFMRESVVRPLVEANERQVAEIQKLSRENGELSAELRIVKQRLDTLQASQAAPQPPSAPEPSPVLSTETLRPEPPRKRRWWQF